MSRICHGISVRLLLIRTNALHLCETAAAEFSAASLRPVDAVGGCDRCPI